MGAASRGGERVSEVDWGMVRALVRETPHTRHSGGCPVRTTRCGIERCTCWVLAEARRTALHVGALVAYRAARAAREGVPG